jgi:hypothetical protein
MDKTSEAIQAVIAAMRDGFEAEPVIDESHGEPNITLRVNGKRYRAYLSDEFADDYSQMKAACDQMLGGLGEALNLSATASVLVTTTGLKEHPGADF